MSKRDLKKYLATLTKAQLEEQLTGLYDKFKEVKVYYDFVFNPKEERLAEAAKQKILQEYFPLKSRRARLRRTVAQQYIKHFLTLGVDPYVIADLMLYTAETAMKYSAQHRVRYDSFYRSSLKSFEQLVDYTLKSGIWGDFKARILAVADSARRQQWENRGEFERILSKTDPEEGLD